MARFLGSASGRTIGAATGAAGFTKAKVFSSIGTTSFTVPDDVSKLKVFVVGAGSSYRTGTYCFVSDNCCSGVDYPKTCYRACFTGHLTGAGGGYAEKTFLQSSDLIAGKTLTINVGSIGGLSASSVSASGITTVTATNATESAYSWSCTSNSTARDNSNDNPISIGIQLPRCGYQNNFSGYYNLGGTASGGDVNRTGGRGVLIPEFLYDSFFDGVNTTASVSATSVNKSSCWIYPTICCACGCNYSSTFGGPYYCNYTSCICNTLCSSISNLCCGSASGTNTIKSYYSFVGKNTKETSSSCYPVGAGSSFAAVSDSAGNLFINDVPIGVGARSGNSSSNGKSGLSEMVLSETTFNKSQPAGSGENSVCIQYGCQGYESTFGGTVYSRLCVCYLSGCFSGDTSLKFVGSSASLCYVDYGMLAYSYCYMSPGCHCFPYGLAAATPVGTYCLNRCYNLGFIRGNSTSDGEQNYTINLSSLTNENGLNINDITYGSGAGISTSASYGGGGNRLYPQPGNGLVVVIY